MPDMSNLSKLYFVQLKDKENSIQVKYNLTKHYINGMNAALTLHHASFKPIFFYNVTHISLFLTFMYSIRMLVFGDDMGFVSDGGLLWFPDLSVRDASRALPMLSVGLTYASIEYAFHGILKDVAMKSKYATPPPQDDRENNPADPAVASSPSSSSMTIITATKDVIQCVILLSVAYVSTLPAGVFCYWIPSSLLSISQSYLLKQSKFRELMSIPKLSNDKKQSPGGMLTSVAEAINKNNGDVSSAATVTVADESRRSSEMIVK